MIKPVAMQSVALLRYRGQALLLLLLLLAIPPAAPLGNGLGLVPPLAYSTWNYFNDAVNDTCASATLCAPIPAALR